MNNNINKIRKSKNMTIQKIADVSGLTIQTVFRVIRGGHPTQKTMVKISEAIGEKIDDVFFL